MGEPSGKKEGIEELLEKIPAEKRWEITVKVLSKLFALRIILTRPLLGTGEGIISTILGWEKHEEIQEKTFGEHGRHFIPWVKETFNIPVEDAIGAAKLVIVAGALMRGPEIKDEIIEATRERAVLRRTQCVWIERYKEYEVDTELLTCPPAHQAFSEEGLKAINPKITHTLTKAIPWGDPYCEWIIEFKKE